jgi:hypothetical protein
VKLVLAPIVAVAKENIVAAEEDKGGKEDSKIEAGEGADVVTNHRYPNIIGAYKNSLKFAFLGRRFCYDPSTPVSANIMDKILHLNM